MAKFSKLFILLIFLICYSRNLTWPLSGVSIMEGHSSFVVVVRRGMGVFVWVSGAAMGKVQPFFC